MSKIKLISISYFCILLSINISGQNAIEIEYDCETKCLNLKINSGYSPYEVEWQFLDKFGNYNTLTGWPKTDLQGNDGNEDLCSNIIEGRSYKVIVHDNLCGNVEETIVVPRCETNCDEMIIITESYSNVSECGGSDDIIPPPIPYDLCNGSITVSVEGGANFQWSNGSTGASISNLCTGSYTVTATKGNCTKTETFEICCCTYTTPTTSPFPPCGTGTISDVDADITSPTGATTKDGSIDILLNLASNIKYKWTGSDGFISNSQDITGLGIGTYCVTINSGCGPPLEKCYTLIDCSGTNISVSGSVINTCSGYSYGSISVNASGGLAPYKYKWSNGKNSSSISNLSNGQYCVTVTDKNGCRGTNCFDVNNSTSLVTNRCVETCNGFIVNNYGPEIDVENPLNCTESIIICEQSGKILSAPFSNTYSDINSFSCVASIYNASSNNLCYSIFGTNCTDCVIFQRGNLIFACDVNYCYFSEFNVSVLNSIREYNSVTSTRVGSGLCRVTIYNDCLGGIEVAVADVECSKVPVQDGDCSDLWKSGDAFRGSFGDCGGILGKINVDKRPLNNRELTKVFDPKYLNINDSLLQKTLVLLNQQNIIIKKSEDCNQIKMTFESPNRTICNIMILSEKGDELFEFEYYANEGVNNILLDRFKIFSDSIIVYIKSNEFSKVQSALINCSKEKISNYEYVVKPNPTNDNIAIMLFEENNKNNEMFRIKLINNIGLIIVDTEIKTKTNQLEIDCSQLLSGIYFLEIFSGNSKLKIQNNKIIKI